MGLARDAGELIHPNLGQAIGYAQTGVQVFNAVTSLADGLGTLASVDPGQIGSIFASTEGLSTVSSVTGNLSMLTRQAGVDVPGLELASTLTSYAALGSQLSGNQTMLARAISPEPINFEATGAQVAGMASGRSQAEVAALVAAARSGNAQAAVALAAQGKGPFEIAMPEEMGPNSTYNPGASASNAGYELGYEHPNETNAVIEVGVEAAALLLLRQGMKGRKPSTSSAWSNENARTYVGHKGKDIKIAPGTNSPTVINGRQYSGHALDRMQQRGLVPSVIEDTIKHGRAIPGTGPQTGTTAFLNNQAKVVVDNASGRVITVMQK